MKFFANLALLPGVISSMSYSTSTCPVRCGGPNSDRGNINRFGQALSERRGDELNENDLSARMLQRFGVQEELRRTLLITTLHPVSAESMH